MKKFLAALMVVVVLFTVTVPKTSAKADGLTLAAIAGGAYAIASASGMNFAFTDYTGQGVSEWMQNRINSWLNGRSIAEAFGTELIRLELGKLVMPMKVVNGIKDFLSDMIQDNGIQEETATATTIQSGTVNGQVYNSSSPMGVNSATNPFAQVYDFDQQPTQGKISATYTTEVSGNKRYYYFTAYNYNATASQTKTLSIGVNDVVTWMKYGLVADTNNGRIWVYYVRYNAEASNENNKYSFASIGSAITIPQGATYTGDITATIPGAYTPPEGLNDLQSWEGTITGAPDTNLDDLLDDIFDQSAAGTLDVEGEVVDTPVEPVPTAAPGDVIGGLDTISGQLESIDNALEGVQEGVGEAVGELEGINEGIGSISEALEVPTTSEAPNFKFDLTTLFPFCIPFDIYRFVTMFSASPVAPHVQIPFNIPAINLQYTFDLDFSSFDSVASILRSVELIAFCVGLAILTSKVIRW